MDLTRWMRSYRDGDPVLRLIDIATDENGDVGAGLLPQRST